MDRFTHAMLGVIAVALVAIAVKMWMPGYATWGEALSISQMADGEAKLNAAASLRARIILLRVHGGRVDVDVTQMP